MDLPNETRFQVELEFVQSLSNPNYLQFLAQQQYFQDEEFLLFIDYLKYWKKPEYCRYIVYPYCLEILDLLAEPEFRDSIKTTDMVTFVHHKEFFQWQSNATRKPIEDVKDDEEMQETPEKIAVFLKKLLDR